MYGRHHTLADVGIAGDSVKKADARFADYKQKTIEATSLTVLDAMITQMLNYKDTACKQIESFLHNKQEQGGGSEQPKQLKIVQMRRYDVFPVKRLQNREDVDSYLENIKQKLYNSLESNDGIQIN